MNNVKLESAQISISTVHALAYICMGVVLIALCMFSFAQLFQLQLG